MQSGIRKFILALVIGLAGSTAQAAPPQVPFGDDFQMIDATVDSGGHIFVLAGVREIKGKLAVCGLIWFENATGTTMSLERQFSSKIGFSIGSTPLPPPTDAFRRYKSEEEVLAKGGMAGCSVTRRAWKASYARMPLVMTGNHLTASQ